MWLLKNTSYDAHCDWVEPGDVFVKGIRTSLLRGSAVAVVKAMEGSSLTTFRFTKASAQKTLERVKNEIRTVPDELKHRVDNEFKYPRRAAEQALEAFKLHDLLQENPDRPRCIQTVITPKIYPEKLN